MTILNDGQLAVLVFCLILALLLAGCCLLPKGFFDVPPGGPGGLGGPPGPEAPQG